MSEAVLLGKSRKGKNRINELGTRWQITRRSNPPGSLLLVHPIGNPQRVRWVHLVGDPDFYVTLVEPRYQRTQ